MKVDVQITREPLVARGLGADDKRSGAVVEFAGVVRAEEGGRIIDCLDYEAYEPMARLEMEKILHSLASEFPCEAAEVRHRIGRVPAGEASILVRLESRHRAEAFGLLSAFMDRLKMDVPIWKSVP